jgi:pimeloyl-[acyl-carrier protein] methyl ester esterase
MQSGVEIYYEELGEGPPIVLLHGWAMSGIVWQFQKEALAAYRRVIIPDLRGHGRSVSELSERLTLSGMADDIVKLIKGLNLEQVVLVSWSLGGIVALKAFAALRERLAGLVLVGSTPRFIAGDGYAHGLPSKDVRGMALRLKRDYSKTMGDFFKEMFVPDEMPWDQYQRVVREIVLPGVKPAPEVALQCLELLAGVDLRDILPGIDRPVLLLHGSCDNISLPGASQYMAEHIPNAVIEVMSGSGHAPFMSRPEEFNRLLGGFLEKLHVRD